MSDVLIPEAFRFLFADTADDGGPVRYRAGFGGRGSAKSHSFCTAAVIKSAARPGFRVGVYREIQKSIRDSAKRLLDDKIDALYTAQPKLRGYFTSTDTEIRTATGGLFLFNGLRTNPDAIKSTEGLDLAIVMEANKVAQRSWDLLIPTVRKPGSEIWAEWNPEDPKDPVDVMFRGEDGPPPGSIIRRINWQDNPFFPDVLLAELEHDKRRDPEKYAHIWLGEYRRNSEARVFRNWTVEEFKAPNDAVHRFGADWGFSVDPTVLVRCHIVGRKLYVDYEAYMVGCEIDNTPALFDSIPESRRYLITADSARPETVSYMQRNGFPKIVPAIKGAGSIEDGIEFLKSFDVIVHPRCTHVADELTLYAYKTDPLTGAVLPQLEDKSNHTIDALRYACEGARRAGKAAPADEPLPAHATGEFGWMT